jgi:tetratricopeptide (TPR) repeat protein
LTFRALQHTTRFFALLAIVWAWSPAFGQDSETRVKEGQEYKMKYNEALEAAQAKEYDKAYAAFEATVPLAQAAGDAAVVAKSNKVLAQLDNSRGTASFKQDKFEDALRHHQKGIEHDNTYAPNHYGKAKAMEKLGRMEEALPLFQAVMTMDDRKSADAAENAIRGHYVFRASTALSTNNGNPSRADAQKAIDALDELELYVEADTDTYYYRAEAFKTMGDYAKSVEAGNKALELHKGSRSDKAKIYFVLGESHMYAGATQDARTAFENAAFGNYKPLAEHYLEELKPQLN